MEFIMSIKTKIAGLALATLAVTIPITAIAAAAGFASSTPLAITSAA
jgi:hypothetical protein